MLTLDEIPFTTARALYRHRLPDESRDRSHVCVQIALPDIGGFERFYAILDTGSEWSILNPSTPSGWGSRPVVVRR